MFKIYEKIQCETLKEASRNKYARNHTSRFSVDIDAENAYICDGGFTIHVIPKAFFFLNPETLIVNHNLHKINGGIYENADNVLTLTGYRATVPAGKKEKTLIEYTDAAGTLYYYDESLLKTFGKVSDFYLKAASPKSPAVVVNEYGDYTGVICPVRHERTA